MKTRLWLVAGATTVAMVSGCKTASTQSPTLTEEAVPTATTPAATTTDPEPPPKICYDVTAFEGVNDFWLENTESICAAEIVRDGDTVVHEFQFNHDFRVLQTYRALRVKPQVPNTVQYVSEGVVITLMTVLKEDTEKQDVLRTLSLAKQDENFKFELAPAK